MRRIWLVLAALTLAATSLGQWLPELDDPRGPAQVGRLAVPGPVRVTPREREAYRRLCREGASPPGFQSPGRTPGDRAAWLDECTSAWARDAR